jgi:CBS domain-containing protein
MKHRKIAKLMVTDVAFVRVDTPFKDVVRLLDDRRLSGVPVVDADRRVVGMVSTSDLLCKESQHEPSGWLARLVRPSSWRARTKAEAVTAGQLMSTPAITVRLGTSLVHAAKLLEEHRITRLPVVDSTGRLVGIVARGDLLRVFLRPDKAIAEEIVHEAFERELGMTVTPATVSVDVRDGVVTLSGEVEFRSQIPAAVAVARRVDGVVDVVSNLTWLVDDRHGRPVGPDTTDILLAVRRGIR